MLADRVQLVQNCIFIVCLIDSLHLLKHTPPEKVRFFSLRSKQLRTVLPIMITLFMRMCLAYDASG